MEMYHIRDLTEGLYMAHSTNPHQQNEENGTQNPVHLCIIASYIEIINIR